MKQCVQCGSSFEPLRNTQKYCNDACRKKFICKQKRLKRHAVKKEKTCALNGCSNTFMPYNAQRFCSKKCGHKFHDEKKRTKRIAVAKPRTCKLETCNNTFVVDGPKRYCSNECRAIQEYLSSLKPATISTCKYCGETLISNRNKKYCNKTCRIYGKRQLTSMVRASIVDTAPYGIVSECIMCGQSKTPNRTRFCSKSCRSKHAALQTAMLDSTAVMF